MEIVKTYELFLDDIRSLEETYSYTKFTPFIVNEWTIVRNYDDFVECIQSQWDNYQAFPELIAFDHDLADEHYGAPVTAIFQEKTGMDCAKWLVEFCMDNELTLPDWICHSMNPAGRDNINHLLLNFRKHQNGREN